MEFWTGVLVLGLLIAAIVLLQRRTQNRSTADQGSQKSTAPPRYSTGIDFSARDRDRGEEIEVRWENAVYAKLTEGGLKPDASCTCYFQTCSDRADSLAGDYLDGGIGIYRDSRFVRIVLGEDNDLDVDDKLELWNANDRSFDEIRAIILRNRATPTIMKPTPRIDDVGRKYWVPYDSWLQTRIYEFRMRQRWDTKESLYCEFKIFSQDRLVFDWLCRNTRISGLTDTQQYPTAGYPD